MTDDEYAKPIQKLKDEIAGTNVYGHYDYMKDYRSGLQMALAIMETGETLIP